MLVQEAGSSAKTCFGTKSLNMISRKISGSKLKPTTCQKYKLPASNAAATSALSKLNSTDEIEEGDNRVSAVLIH